MLNGNCPVQVFWVIAASKFPHGREVMNYSWKPTDILRTNNSLAHVWELSRTCLMKTIESRKWQRKLQLNKLWKKDSSMVGNVYGSLVHTWSIQILTVTPFWGISFLKHHGKRTTMVHLTGVYANPVLNDSLSKLRRLVNFWPPFWIGLRVRYL